MVGRRVQGVVEGKGAEGKEKVEGEGKGKEKVKGEVER